MSASDDGRLRVLEALDEMTAASRALVVQHVMERLHPLTDDDSVEWETWRTEIRRQLDRLDFEDEAWWEIAEMTADE